MRFLPVAPVVLPLITAALLAALTKLLSRLVCSIVSIACTIATVVCAGLLFTHSLSQPIVYWFGAWKSQNHVTLGISFTIDPIGAGLATFTAVLATAALIFTSEYFDSAENHFHALILCFVGAMCGFSLTGDVFNLFVFFELMSAAAFALCAYKTEDASALQGALNFGVVNTIGAYFVVTGIALLYARTGALNMAQIAETLKAHPPDKLVAVAFAFICCGYLVKAAIVPFHFWLADAHAVAPSPVCVLFSGVMVEMGLYAVARTYWAVFDQTLHPYFGSVRALLVDIGLLTALVGAIMCYTQRNLKRLLAFSTISHMGLMTIGVGLGTAAGLAGTAIYTIGHGLVKGALFLAAGILLHRFSSVDEFDLHGRGKETKWAAVVMFVGAIGLAGFPPSSLSHGDDLIRAAARTVNFAWIRWVSVFAASVTSAAVLRATCRIFLGWGSSTPDIATVGKSEEKRETDEVMRVPLSMLAPAVALVAAGFLFSAVPSLPDVAQHAAAVFENSAGYVNRVLQGASVPAANVQPLHPSKDVFSYLPLVLALSGTAAHLFSPKFRSVSRSVTVPLRFLQGLHSGHLGDYVAFLTLGVAVFGIACMLWFR